MSPFTVQESVRSRAGNRRQELAECLPAIREALERERAFRVEQLAGLSVRTGSGSGCAEPDGGDEAVREVEALIVAGARQALADIERALGAIRAGQYGRCADCSEAIPIAVLRAVPQSRLCGMCHRREIERAGAGPDGGGRLE